MAFALLRVPAETLKCVRETSLTIMDLWGNIFLKYLFPCHWFKHIFSLFHGIKSCLYTSVQKYLKIMELRVFRVGFGDHFISFLYSTDCETKVQRHEVTKPYPIKYSATDPLSPPFTAITNI